MLAKLIAFFKPPEYENIEQAQKARFLHFALIVCTAAGVLLAILNLSGSTSLLPTFLFVAAGISFLCIPVNKRGATSLWLFLSPA